MASPDILVRPARADDAAALIAVLRDTFESTWRPNISPAAAQAHLEEDRPARYVEQSSLEFRVAERDGQVIGLVHWKGDFVHALHVRSSHARQGAGARLMDCAEAEIATAAQSRTTAQRLLPERKLSMEILLLVAARENSKRAQAVL